MTEQEADQLKRTAFDLSNKLVFDVDPDESCGKAHLSTMYQAIIMLSLTQSREKVLEDAAARFESAKIHDPVIAAIGKIVGSGIRKMI